MIWKYASEKFFIQFNSGTEDTYPLCFGGEIEVEVVSVNAIYCGKIYSKKAYREYTLGKRFDYSVFKKIAPDIPFVFLDKSEMGSCLFIEHMSKESIIKIVDDFVSGGNMEKYFLLSNEGKGWRTLEYISEINPPLEDSSFMCRLKSLYSRVHLQTLVLKVPCEENDFDYRRFRTPYHVLANPSVRAQLTYLQVSASDHQNWSDVQPVGTYPLLGTLLGIVCGAESPYMPKPSAALIKENIPKAEEFMVHFHHFEKSYVWVLHRGWSAFFYNDAWDCTIIDVDNQNGRVNILCLSDTD